MDATLEKKRARFAFGKNWKSYSKLIDDSRINAAQEDLKTALGVADLKGKTFLDIGSGSGLSSLAAHGLGAKVTSYDYDQDSVDCTVAVHQEAGAPKTWTVQQGSVLDEKFQKSLGKFDVVYSWGVLHHTGDMWQALNNVQHNMKKSSQLFIAIYNNQGFISEAWKKIKKTYVTSPKIIQWGMIAIFSFYFASKNLVHDVLNLKNPLKRYKQSARGMSVFYDWVDWIGGYPFEVASPEAIFSFYKEKGLDLTYLRTVRGSHGCNIFVFKKN